MLRYIFYSFLLCFNVLMGQSPDSLLYQLQQLENDTERVNQLCTKAFELRTIDLDVALQFASLFLQSDLCDEIVHAAFQTHFVPYSIIDLWIKGKKKRRNQIEWLICGLGNYLFYSTFFTDCVYALLKLIRYNPFLRCDKCTCLE